MPLCGKNFESKFAKLEGRIVTFDEYARMENTPSIRCVQHGHDLIPIFCTKRKPHFRHKHEKDMDDNPMTQWHAEWQSNFPMTEIEYKNNSKQLRNRRADIVIPQFKRIIEIQHSKIESGEVSERMEDYKLHGHSVEWVIDAQGCIRVKKIGDKLILHFTSNTWLFESFLGCEYIYYDINDIIYKVKPSHVKSSQVEVVEPMLKGDFIANINTSAELWNTGELAQSHIYVKQKGAGSGKTYGMMQLLNTDPEISNFKFIIFITKQHSAVNVMFTEFMKQYIEKDLNNIQLLEEPYVDGKYDDSMFKFEKRFIVPYKHKLTNVDTCAIFATVDSFTHAIGEPVSDAHDTFVSIVQSIKDGFSKVTRTGRLSFAKMSTMINKETLIMIDETQDLIKLYGEAFVQFVSSTNTNLCVVGDRLQTLQNEENALTFLHNADITTTRVIRETASNEIRRFSDPKLLRFVNDMIKFKDWGLPEMTLHEVGEEKPNALEVFLAETIYANQDSKCDEVVRAVTQIMEYVEREAIVNKCIPEDFLFVTPCTKQNPLVEALQLAVNEFWKNTMQHNISYIEEVKSKHDYWKHIDPNSYTRYAIFHKAQEGGSINLEESKHASRMVSIHSSKGDGRKVVFVLGVTEASLRLFSQVTNNIIYTSFLHVAITRQKERLYFRLEENGDDIYTRIKNSTDNISTLSTKFEYPKKTLQLSHLADDVYTSHWDALYENVISKVTIRKIPFVPTPVDSEDVLLLDMGDHNIRYSSMLINLMVHRCNYEYTQTIEGKARDDRKLQFNSIFKNIERNVIRDVSTWKEYWKILAKNTSINDRNIKNKYNAGDEKESPCIPMLTFAQNKTDLDYERYSKIIRKTMERVRNEITNLNKGKILYFCPLESVICYYMLECVTSGKYQKITINDVYNIIHLYTKTFDPSSKGHDACKCKEHFTVKHTSLNEYETKCQKYLLHHYDRMNHLTNLLDEFSAKYPSVNFLYENHIQYGEGSNEFNLYKRFRLIGYDKESVYVFDIKPQLNEINHNETKVSGILDTWMISNVSDDNPKYANKRIISCVISLNITEVYTNDWTDVVEANAEYLKNQVYTIIQTSHENKNKSYYTTFINILEGKKDVKAILAHIQSSYIDPETKLKKSIPAYIIGFWEFIENLIGDEDGKSAKMQKLNEYRNEEYFLKKMNRFLKRSLDAYFNIDTDE